MRKAFLIITLLLVTAAANAESLYPTSPATPGSLFADDKAQHVGDPLTVVINETSSGNITATTATSKTESADVGPGFGPLLSLLKSFGANTSIAQNGTGASSRNDVLTATIAVVVKQVNPNGTMVIEGSKSVGTNSDTEVITLTGLVRISDVAPDNTVQSPLVANAVIHYSGKGPVGEKQRDGIINKIFKVLF